MQDGRRIDRTIGPTREAASGAAERAPLAAAAALGVLAGGAAFLAFAMSRPTDTASPSIVGAPVAATSVPGPAASQQQEIPGPGAVERGGGRADESGASPAGGDTQLLTHAQTDSAPVPGDYGDDDGFPGMKPALPASAVSAEPPPGVLSFASVWAADENERPPSFLFESDLNQAPFAQSSPSFPDGDVANAPFEMRVSLAKGETFVDALKRAGVRAEDRNAAAYAFGKVYNLRRLLPGQEFALTIAEPNRTFFQSVSESAPPPAYLVSIDFKADAENRIIIERSAQNGFSAKEFSTPVTRRMATLAGRIDGSLYLSAKRQGAPDDVIAGLAQMFAYDVDFQREIFGGDEFEAVFEVIFDDSGKVIGGGDILFGRLKWRGRQKEKGYYRFAAASSDKADYFDASGESARRLLMKTPIDGARLSSGFGTRKHPILGYQKAHKGVDFAASRGTPIMAAGDGVIERAGPYGSFGNYVRIRHAQGYKTAYAHMNSIKKGVRTGVRVRQGEVIGYVGTTGRSTGPHLHYEVHLKDTPVNPQSLKIATGYELAGQELSRFKEIKGRIDAMRLPVQNGGRAELLADAKADKDAL